MFRFGKQIFSSVMMFFGCNVSNVNPLKCVSGPEIVNVNSDEPTFCIILIK